jgi:hypothetical protein
MGDRSGQNDPPLFLSGNVPQMKGFLSRLQITGKSNESLIPLASFSSDLPAVTPFLIHNNTTPTEPKPNQLRP